MPPRKDVKTPGIIFLRPHRLPPGFCISNILEFGTTNKGLFNGHGDICARSRVVVSFAQPIRRRPTSRSLLVARVTCCAHKRSGDRASAGLSNFFVICWLNSSAPTRTENSFLDVWSSSRNRLIREHRHLRSRAAARN